MFSTYVSRCVSESCVPVRSCSLLAHCVCCFWWICCVTGSDDNRGKLHLHRSWKACRLKRSRGFFSGYKHNKAAHFLGCPTWHAELLENCDVKIMWTRSECWHPEPDCWAAEIRAYLQKFNNEIFLKNWTCKLVNMLFLEYMCCI